MSDMIAICGLDCGECGAYRATVANDDGLREKTAGEWSRMYGGDIKAESINCLGCRQDEVLFGHCRNGCAIRACAVEKGHATCAACSDFGCGKVLDLWQHDGDAKRRLEELRV